MRVSVPFFFVSECMALINRRLVLNVLPGPKEKHRSMIVTLPF